MSQLCSRSLRAWICLLVLSVSAGALDPSRQVTQYAHTAWRIQDGFFRGTPQAITQTLNGYLWIGTEAGLVRFDGVRFVSWTAKNGQHLPSARIHAVLGARDGSLWIGTSRGLVRLKDDDLVTIQTQPAFIESIVEKSPQDVWVTRSQVKDTDGPLCEVVADALRCVGEAEGISFPFAQPLVLDSQQNLWFGSSLGIGRFKSGDAKTYLVKALQGNEKQAGISAIAENSNGSMLVGVRRTGKGLGLQQFSQGQWNDFSVPGFDGARVVVSALLRDRDNGLWVGTADSGIYRVHGDIAEHFSSIDGLSSDSVQGFFEDREGNLWVATARGIDRFHETPVVSYSIREALKAEDADSVLAARDGTVWIGNLQALEFLRNGKISSITRSEGLPGRLITSLLEDDDGRLWVGIDNRLTVYDGAHFRPVNQSNGEPLGIVTAMSEDGDHNLWVAVTEPALFRIQNLRVQTELRPPVIPRVSSIANDQSGGIWLGLANGVLARYRQGHLETMPNRRPQNHAIRNLMANEDGSIWGATQDGAFLWKEGREQVLDARNGLPCDDVYTIVKDNGGSLWFDTECGFVIVPGSEVDRWWQQPDSTLKVRTLDVFDGAQPGLTNFRPEASKAPDGKLWFANENILQSVDPAHLAQNKVPPPVEVEQVIADRIPYTPRQDLRLPARTRDIEIDYAALSLVAPEKVRFRYILEGHDSEWQNPQSRRQAFYNDLPPGKYTFRVVASNNDGVWNQAGAALGFEVRPAFYQTYWFRMCCLLAIAGTLALAYVLRLRHLAGRLQARFAERLEERERIARDLHDTLLQGIYSASLHFDVANNRLSNDSPAKPAVQRGVDLLRQVSQEGRNALRSLRSTETSSDNIEDALSRLPEEFAVPADVDFQVVTDDEVRLIQPLIRDEAYLIAREAVINAFRHSQASKIEVEVNYAPRQFRISIRDNGCGIDAGTLKTGREGHWGLAGIRERADRIGAKLEVSSRVNGGTEIDLSVPGAVAYQENSAGGSWQWLTRPNPKRRAKKG
jgi:signal transduction histidine kinase/ligand-binding sensor domain-containing protein